ncbi:minichromosome maintenance domain-containing protein 2-like isoform X2 [Dysidea avara]|uniref:minichromosome maintenance domain-containing protein 2-like isoform X2 n=1 Tax=Dysidea avara TaxID=196820 RepID=UPI003332880E
MRTHWLPRGKADTSANKTKLHERAEEEQCDVESGSGDLHQRVYRLVLPLDVAELLDYSVELGDAILHHPSKAWSLFQEVVYTSVVVLQWLPSLSAPSQLLLVLRLSQFPQLPGYVIRSTSDIPAVNSEPHFISLTGIVTSVTTPSQYTQSASFRCPQEDCLGDGDFIRLHVAGASEASTIRSDLYCAVCGHKLKENMKYRSLGDKLVINMILVSSLHINSSTSPHRHQAISVVLRDELMKDVLLGGMYSVIGIPVYELCGTSASINVSIEANNITTVGITANVPCVLSSTVREIYDACSYSPWAFAATMAYSFAAQVTPRGTYHQLKLAMLLSLVCCGAEDLFSLSSDLNTTLSINWSPSQFVNLLLIGEDDVIISRLLHYGSQFAHRSVLHSHQTDLTGCVHKEDKHYSIDAGSLLLASNGVCVIRDINLYKKDIKETVQRVLESRQVSVSGGRREQATTGGINYTTPLTCTIWTACNGYNKEISRTFTDWFTLVVDNNNSSSECDEFVSDQMVIDIITHHITGQHQDDLVLSRNDFEQLLATSSHIDVSLSPAAQQLIQSFYLASRRARSGSDSDIPTTAFTSLCLLAIAHARLSLRSEAVEEDAVLAISLYEESLTSRSGYSVLNIVPIPHFRDSNTGAYIGQQYDDNMTQLHQQIIKFSKLHQYAGVYMNEE